MITKITGRSHSAGRSLHYIYYGKYDQHHGRLNEAHPNTNGVTKRNEFISGVDCRADDYGRLMKEWDYYLGQKPKGQLQALNIVLSFKKSDFDFNSPADAVDAVHIGRDFVHQAFPNHQAIIAAQHDNTNGIPHVHICVNQVDERSLKAINGRYSNFWRLKRISNKALADYEYDTDRKMKHNYDYSRKKFTYQHNIKPTTYEQTLLSKLIPIVQNRAITSKAKFRSACRDVGIRPRFSRAGSRRRRRSRRKRKRAGLSFKMSGHNYVKASQLAKFVPSVSLVGVRQIITRNKQLSRQRAENRRLRYRKSVASQSAMARARASQTASISIARSMFASASLSQSISYSARASYSTSQSMTVSVSQSLSVSTSASISTRASLSQSASLRSRSSLSVSCSRASVSASVSMAKSSTIDRMASKYASPANQLHGSTGSFKASQSASEVQFDSKHPLIIKSRLHLKEYPNHEKHIQDQKDVSPTRTAINRAEQSLKRPARHSSKELSKASSSARKRIDRQAQATSKAIQASHQRATRQAKSFERAVVLYGTTIESVEESFQRVRYSISQGVEEIPERIRQSQRSIKRHFKSLQVGIEQATTKASRYGKMIVHWAHHPQEHRQHLKKLHQQHVQQQRQQEANAEDERKRRERIRRIHIAHERNQGPIL